MNELKVEMRRADTLAPYPRNARTHSEAQIAEIARSMQEFGWTNPILVDGDSGVIAGHGRLLAASKLGMDVVPVIELAHLTPAQRRALVLADNRIAMSGGWDAELLTLELSELKELGVDLNILGFTDEEILVALEPLKPGLTDPDEVPEPPVTPISRTGDLWILGKHRLLCGDSTNAQDVERVLAGEKPRLLLTDPPYGVELDMEWRDRMGVKGADGKIIKTTLNTLGKACPSYLQRQDGHTNTTISGDTKADWSDAFELVPSLDTAYVWHASAFAMEVAQGLKRIGFEIKQQIIWRKPHFVLSRQHYHWQHEPCWYARKPGSEKFRGSRDQSTVWDANSPKMLMSGKQVPGDEKVDHPTQKPLVLYTRPIENHLAPGGCFYEPFGGSGSGIMAAEATGRRAYCMELDPRFVDVIVLRWQAFTGKDAVLEETGRTFADVAGERGQEAA